MNVEIDTNSETDFSNDECPMNDKSKYDENSPPTNNDINYIG